MSRWKIAFIAGLIIVITLVVGIVLSSIYSEAVIKTATFLAAIAEIVAFLLTLSKLDKTKNENSGQDNKNLPKNNFSINTDWLQEKFYGNFIGRKNEVQEIINFFENPVQNRNTFFLYGFGGMGKSALCRYAIEEIYKYKIFENILWLGTSQNSYIVPGDEIVPNKDISPSYAEIVKDIAMKLGIPNRLVIPFPELEEKIISVLIDNKILLIVDGLEDAHSPHEIVSRLADSLGNRSKLFITSREVIQSTEYAYIKRLDPFTYDETRLFIQDLSNSNSELKKYKAIIFKDYLETIFKATDGIPLLIKVMVSQMAYLSFDRVLEKFQQAENNNLNTYLLSATWQKLLDEDPNSIKILKLLTHFADTMDLGLIYEFLSTIEKNEIDDSITKLTDLALIENGFERNRRYVKLHSYIQNFIRTK